MTKIVEAVGLATASRSGRMRVLLAAIDDLTLEDCLEFFDQQDERTRKIVEMAIDDSFEADTNNIMTDSELNGAYVLGWRWVDFKGTDLDEAASDVPSGIASANR